MTPQRRVAFITLFLVALLAIASTDVALCGEVEVAQGLTDELNTVESSGNEEGSVPGSPEQALDANGVEAVEVPGDAPQEDDELESNELIERPFEDRPKTTKHLYTARRSVRSDRRVTTQMLTKANVFLLVLVVVLAGLLVFKGKGSSLNEDDSEDDD